MSNSHLSMGCYFDDMQASDDARRMVEEARANAQTEVDAARATVLRVEAALQEQAQSLSIAEKEV